MFSFQSSVQMYRSSAGQMVLLVVLVEIILLVVVAVAVKVDANADPEAGIVLLLDNVADDDGMDDSSNET